MFMRHVDSEMPKIVVFHSRGNNAKSRCLFISWKASFERGGLARLVPGERPDADNLFALLVSEIPIDSATHRVAGLTAVSSY